MELPVAWSENDAMLPVNPQKILLAFVPKKRMAVTQDAHHVEARPVPVSFFKSSSRHLRNVRVHGPVGQHKHDIAAAGAPVAPGLQLELRQIGYEIGLPHMIARPHRDQVAMTGEVLAFAGTV